MHLGYKAKRMLLQIFNLSWHSGKFPSKWKETHIRPILKKGKDKSKPESYRPISLLSCMGKLLERIINKRLISYLESNSLLAPTQLGYRQNHSTEDQLAYFTQEVEGPCCILRRFKSLRHCLERWASSKTLALWCQRENV